MLSNILKLYERRMHNKLHEYFNDVLSIFQFRFRKDHGVQHILSFIIGNSKQFGDNKGAFAAVLTDLLQVFDFI